jgi:hypothetical protein
MKLSSKKSFSKTESRNSVVQAKPEVEATNELAHVSLDSTTSTESSALADMTGLDFTLEAHMPLSLFGDMKEKVFSAANSVAQSRRASIQDSAGLIPGPHGATSNSAGKHLLAPALQHGFASQSHSRVQSRQGSSVNLAMPSNLKAGGTQQSGGGVEGMLNVGRFSISKSATRLNQNAVSVGSEVDNYKSMGSVHRTEQSPVKNSMSLSPVLSPGSSVRNGSQDFSEPSNNNTSFNPFSATRSTLLKPTIVTNSTNSSTDTALYTPSHVARSRRPSFLDTVTNAVQARIPSPTGGSAAQPNLINAFSTYAASYRITNIPHTSTETPIAKALFYDTVIEAASNGDDDVTAVEKGNMAFKAYEKILAANAAEELRDDLAGSPVGAGHRPTPMTGVIPDTEYIDEGNMNEVIYEEPSKKKEGPQGSTIHTDFESIEDPGLISLLGLPPGKHPRDSRLAFRKGAGNGTLKGIMTKIVKPAVDSEKEKSKGRMIKMPNITKLRMLHEKVILTIEDYDFVTNADYNGMYI